MNLLPRLTYNGLTIVMSNPSRFDVQEKTLLAAFAGKYVNQHLMRGGTNLFKCNIRTVDTVRTPHDLLPQTKVILALGSKAIQFFRGTPNDKDFQIDQQRGTPGMWCDVIPFIGSYLPQDCFDRKDFEGAYNPEAEARTLVTKAARGETDDGDKGHKMRTDFANYKFWLGRDIAKTLTLLDDNARQTVLLRKRPKVSVYPDANKAIQLLTETKGAYLNLDIENDNAYNIYCIGFSFDAGDIYVVPITRYNYELAYSPVTVAKLLRAFAVAMRDNTTVIHNDQYDLWVLAHRYGLPFGRRIYDTMLAQHRCFVDVEKSLGHTISYWLYEPFHKNDAVFQPSNPGQEKALWEYNGKDVAVLDVVRKLQLEYADSVPGLRASIEQSNNSCYAYLVSSLTGMRYNAQYVEEITAENDNKMMQLIRIIKLLVGGDRLVLPTSNLQCVQYFHRDLLYPPVKISTKTRQPSLAKDALYKLKLKNPDNAMIDTCIEYRRLSKETGSLKFIPWREVV